ncbi:MAG TPA: nuclear transport factor 2 family protein [Candidatus Acidoferrum sp.]
MSAGERNVKVMLEIFRAIEERDRRRMFDLVHPDAEFLWPPALPYVGARNPKPDEPGWGTTWIPLQPGEADRRLEPRVVAFSDEEVVIQWRQKGVTPKGDRIDTLVLGLYRLRDGKLARAQMFYFDCEAVVAFLSKAKAQTASAS